MCVKKRQKGEGLYVIEMERRNTCSGGNQPRTRAVAPGPTKLCPALRPALVWFTAAVFDLDLARSGSRTLACDEGPLTARDEMSLVYVDWSAVGLSFIR